jgi:hypothetical protein
MLLEGIFAAVPTPFYPDERIYFRKLEANVARYSRSLLAGMVVLGSTGEAPALNDAESRDVLRPKQLLPRRSSLPGSAAKASVPPWKWPKPPPPSSMTLSSSARRLTTPTR